MVSPAGIPSADEALKTLITRFRSEPAPSVFAELAAALLARGHATEALKIAEHGLESAPAHVEGRVERAAALLALGRPRVAYVELRRVLAIEPRHRRALRLLGEAYKEAGAPERAAQLLARRLAEEPESEFEVTAITKAPDFEAPIPRPPEVRGPASMPIVDRPDTPTEATQRAITPMSPSETFDSSQRARKASASDSSSMSSTPSTPTATDLFSELTKDLGLGSMMPTAPVRRVEVTQIIRRRGPARPPRSDSELTAIDGPIVDKTHPGHAFEIADDAPRLAVAPKEPMALNDPSSTTAELAFGAYALEDEPVFQENMPFAIAPVETEPPEPSRLDDKTSLEARRSSRPVPATRPMLGNQGTKEAPFASLAESNSARQGQGSGSGSGEASIREPFSPLLDVGVSEGKGQSMAAGPTHVMIPGAPGPYSGSARRIRNIALIALILALILLGGILWFSRQAEDTSDGPGGRRQDHRVVDELSGQETSAGRSPE